MNKPFHFIFMFTIGSLLLAACSNQPKQQAPPPVAVNTYQVQKGTAVYFDNYPATVTALNQIELRAQVTGYVKGIFFNDGQHVSKGQKLYDIDHETYQAAYNQAVANMNVAQANLDKAQQDADRYTDLLKKDAIARQVVDHAITDLQAAKMQVAAAKAAVARAATDLKFSVLYAPFDGTIGISQVKMGALISANQTLLNTLSSDNPMAVDIAVDQSLIPKFTNLKNNPAPAADSMFTLTFNDKTIYPYPGQISFIDRAVDPQTSTIRIRYIFPNNNNLLKPGMSCNVRVKNNNAKEQFMLIPYKAVVEQMGEYFVFVVKNNNTVSEQKVMLGQPINDKIVVKSGLNDGDVIVTDGVQKLKDGAKIQLSPAKAH